MTNSTKHRLNLVSATAVGLAGSAGCLKTAERAATFTDIVDHAKTVRVVTPPNYGFADGGGLMYDAAPWVFALATPNPEYKLLATVRSNQRTSCTVFLFDEHEKYLGVRQVFAWPQKGAVTHLEFQTLDGDSVGGEELAACETTSSKRSERRSAK